jgi:hypothetical protein
MRKFFASALLAGLLSGPALAATVDVYLVPQDSVIGLGDTVMVDIYADISDPVLGWGLDLDAGNPAVADKTGNLSIGGAWNPAAANDGDDLAGLVPFPPVGISGNGILLASVEFQGLSLGLTTLELGDDYPNDLSEGFALDPTGFADVTYTNGSIRVVPEPAALGLLVLGGLVALRRR